MTDHQGRPRITGTAGEPLNKVHAKPADGSVRLYGYTDIRRRFDHASVNTPELHAVERFAVLVPGGDRGAAIREAAPLPRSPSHPGGGGHPVDCKNRITGYR